MITQFKRSRPTNLRKSSISPWDFDEGSETSSPLRRLKGVKHLTVEIVEFKPAPTTEIKAAEPVKPREVAFAVRRKPRPSAKPASTNLSIRTNRTTQNDVAIMSQTPSTLKSPHFCETPSVRLQNTKEPSASQQTASTRKSYAQSVWTRTQRRQSAVKVQNMLLQFSEGPSASLLLEPVRNISFSSVGHQPSLEPKLRYLRRDWRSRAKTNYRAL